MTQSFSTVHWKKPGIPWAGRLWSRETEARYCASGRVVACDVLSFLSLCSQSTGFYPINSKKAWEDQSGVASRHVAKIRSIGSEVLLLKQNELMFEQSLPRSFTGWARCCQLVRDSRQGKNFSKAWRRSSKSYRDWTCPTQWRTGKLTAWYLGVCWQLRME